MPVRFAALLRVRGTTRSTPPYPVTFSFRPAQLKPRHFKTLHIIDLLYALAVHWQLTAGNWLLNCYPFHSSISFTKSLNR